MKQFQCKLKDFRDKSSWSVKGFGFLKLVSTLGISANIEN